MAVTIVTTPGASNANSYASVADLQAYEETRINSSDISALTTDQLGGLLVSATRLFDQCNPLGLKYYNAGSLRWPRSGVFDRDCISNLDYTTVPTDLRDAVCEQALSDVDSDRSYDDDMKGFKRIKIGVLEFEADKGDKPATIAPQAFNMVDYLFSGDSEFSVRTLRV